MERNRRQAAKQRSDYNEHLVERAAFQEQLVERVRASTERTKTGRSQRIERAAKKRAAKLARLNLDNELSGLAYR